MDYWKNCIQEAFEESGIVATNEQISNVAAWAENAHENYGLAHGREHIPNPLACELREANRRADEANKRADQERENFRANVARRRGVHPNQVEISSDGRASYYV